MFARLKKQPGDAAGISVIGPGVSIEGDLRFSGVLRVDGTVQGKMSALPGQPATLIVGAGGRVQGEVAVPHLVVHGTLNGVTMECDHLELTATARLTGGHVYYRSMDVSPGAIVQAQLVSRATTISQAEAAVAEPSLAPAHP